MEIDKFFDEFGVETTEQDELKTQENLGSKDLTIHPTHSAAIQIIGKLKKEKMRYIKGHSEDKDFKTKGLWQIKKAEVAKAIDKKPGSLFHRNTFSGELLTYFNNVNKYLEKAKENKLNKKKSGYQNLSKSDLIKEAQKTNAELDEVTKNNCETLFQMMLDELPLDIKQKLKIKL